MEMSTGTVHFTFLIDSAAPNPRAARALADAQRLAALEARVDRVWGDPMDDDTAIRQIDAVVAQMLQIVRRTVPTSTAMERHLS